MINFTKYRFLGPKIPHKFSNKYLPSSPDMLRTKLNTYSSKKFLEQMCFYDFLGLPYNASFFRTRRRIKYLSDRFGPQNTFLSEEEKKILLSKVEDTRFVIGLFWNRRVYNAFLRDEKELCSIPSEKNEYFKILKKLIFRHYQLLREEEEDVKSWLQQYQFMDGNNGRPPKPRTNKIAIQALFMTHRRHQLRTTSVYVDQQIQLIRIFLRIIAEVLKHMPSIVKALNKFLKK